MKMIIITLIDIWGIASIVDFFINYTNIHKWNIINVLWELIGKYI